MRQQISAARRREKSRRFWRWLSTALALSSALVIALRAPLPADAMLAYFLAALVALIAVKSSPQLALAVVPVALIAYRAFFELRMLDQPNLALTLAVAALNLGVAVATSLHRAASRELSVPGPANPAAKSPDYDVFLMLVSKDLARCQRHKTASALALFRLRGLDALLAPDAYQQHDLVVGQLLRVFAQNTRSGDSACYLGNLLFAIAMPQTDRDGALAALDRLRTVAAHLPRRLCPALSRRDLDWEAVCLEYPHEGATAEELIAAAARSLSAVAEQRVATLEERRAVARRHLERLGYA